MAGGKNGGIFEAAIRNFLGPIVPLLEDERVTEVMINGAEEIWVEIAGKIQKTKVRFQDEDALRAAVNNIAQSVGRRINDEEPRLDARLPNGYRIHAVIPPCSRKGTTVAIRKFASVQMTFKDYVRIGAMSVDAAQFLDICMKLGKNILVSGGTGSGKTTLLSVLCNRIPRGQRIIVIEDSSELKVEYEHVVFFETRMPDEMGKGEVTIRDLLKSSLRLRPDRIIVGEVRGSEALELVQAMNTGHKGCLGTVHANSPSDAIVRLEALAQGGDKNLSEKALRYQIGSAIDLIIQVSRYPDGSRRLGSIAEVRGFNPDGTYNVVPLMQLSRLLKRADGSLQGQIEPTGEVPTFMEEIEDNQIPFPRTKFTRSAA
ncbi:MAG: CpaF family protein [Bdellovibrionaceae bacterium]|nr:CpaF family protein [Bdellovibrionales bacterium]MCB9086624.1 CpaF family protein [Pseudobdellovibrionaceae bacterium]